MHCSFGVALDHGANDLIEHLLLGGKVVVQRCAIYAHLGGDRADARTLKAQPVEYGDRGVGDLLTSKLVSGAGLILSGGASTTDGAIVGVIRG